MKRFYSNFRSAWLLFCCAFLSNLPVSASNLQVSIPARLIEVQLANAKETWLDINSLARENKLITGVKYNIRGLIDNSSSLGGGPFDIKNLTITYRSTGFGKSVFTNYYKESPVNTISLGALKAGDSLNRDYSIYPIKRGTQALSLEVSSELFDPDQSNNRALRSFVSSGMELKINGQTNHSSFSQRFPVTISVSNNLNEAFVKQNQLLNYWLLVLYNNVIYSWTFSGFVPGIQAIGTYPLIHFEDYVIVANIFLPPGNYQALACIGSDKHDIPELGSDACDFLNLDIAM